MKSFIFLLALIALISSLEIPDHPKFNFPNLNPRNEDEYGCVIPSDSFLCYWINPTTCCDPKKQHGCSKLRTNCCKMKGDIIDGKQTYDYPKAKIIG